MFALNDQMPVQNIPEIFIATEDALPELYVYDYRMTDDVVHSKVELSLHLFSFLQTGHKKVHFGDTAAAVNENQSILIRKGNCLMTELLDNEQVYYCKLFFFSQEKLVAFLTKHADACSFGKITDPASGDLSLFVIENDAYIKSFVQSLSSIIQLQPLLLQQILEIKFEEIMLYLLHKYGQHFVLFLNALVASEKSSFKKTVDAYACSNLKLEDIAFLCNMSLSTFKRHFIQEFGLAPGKWLQQQRLGKARVLLQNKSVKPSDIYADFGYSNLSGFSTAFKNEFGVNPSEC